MHRPWVIAGILAAAGCSMPQHSNTLVFGTDTKVAFDVSGTDGSTVPSITLGYKRTEIAWIPLVANESSSMDGNAKAYRCSDQFPLHDCAFVGTAGNDRDAYSVLGTFGATFEGGANGASPGVTAGAGIAQYFATGHAARLLALRAGPQAVSTQPLTATDQGAALQLMVQQQKDLASIATHFAGQGGFTEAKRDSLVNSSALPAKDYPTEVTTAKTLEAFLVALTPYQGFRSAIANAARKS